MDFDSKLLRYFATVAEEENLTAAAELMRVSQPALTKQMKRLEDVLGVQLFVRSHTGMALTEAGRALAGRVPSLLAAWDRTVRETRAEARRAVHVLRVGFVASGANEATQQIIAEFAGRRPGWRVDTVQAAWSDPTAGLASGEVDAALVRLPFPGSDAWNVRDLFTEPRCLALAAAHPLAERDVIAFHELLDEPFVAAPPETGEWRDYWLASDQRHGQAARIGAVTAQPDEWLNAIANGYGIALAPESASRYYARPGVVYRPLTGVSPSRVGVAWPPHRDDDAAVRDFVHSCLAATSP
ncbi:LysR family transcriptional regulator [Actinomadura rupiterrae]|uniref:LysR family transcriptional regulator n=1 Tax=Actinomadura rupiterrae TaxID=559627 RepID=UPI0020A2ECFA|nr:LysR family transcriptional regulator [Actinomadura rupiterrae]MCP2336350.1 DNA-binding transcriptional LysR family regulator [Actinomadura rupiterrae]